jgi:hypothetical protein
MVQYIQGYFIIYLKLWEGKYAKPEMGTVKIKDPEVGEESI